MEEKRHPQPDPLARFHGSHKLAGGAGDAHILDYLASIDRYRFLSAGVFLMVVIAALLKAYTKTPMYRAQARVMIEIEDDKTTALAGVLTGENIRDPEPNYQTQFRILTGRDLARRTAENVHLTDVPEFNGTGVAQPPLARLAAS